MVAPTRAPQARGVKCDLCKKILDHATWLDQTKLAKDIPSAQRVLKLIDQHNGLACPCIPKSIQNLLIGSTHFEIHRLSSKALDSQVFKRQAGIYKDLRIKHQLDRSKQDTPMNDCFDHWKISRFKVHSSYYQDERDSCHAACEHLRRAIDFWKIAMEDTANPFNSKLALRLGLTHHVIYACYLFKFYKILDYQLKSANLLLNLFRSIDGVTANAVLHANYLLIRSLLDCDQRNLAKYYLKQAIKSSQALDKNSYESILIACISCELNMLDKCNPDDFNQMAELAIIQKGDKLQHYYARNLALSTLIRYIHCYHPVESNQSIAKAQCMEFYHLYRYTCAIIRRCYDSSFNLVLSERESPKQTAKSRPSSEHPQQQEIIHHSWIRSAVCDFVFSTYDQLSEFFTRAGQPEVLELLHNGLDMISYRMGSCYWQARIACLGASFDLLCDKFDHCRTKIDHISKIINNESDKHLSNLLRLELEINQLLLENQDDKLDQIEAVDEILRRLRNCARSLATKLDGTELFDCRNNQSNLKLASSCPVEKLIILDFGFSRTSLICFRLIVSHALRRGDSALAKRLIMSLASQLETCKTNVLEYYCSQSIMETLLDFVDISRSEQIMLDSITSSDSVFLQTDQENLTSIESQLSSMTLNNDNPEILTNSSSRKKETKCAMKSILTLRKRSKRYTYDVAYHPDNRVRFFDTVEVIKNFEYMTSEELLACYLRNSEPNPDFLLYRRAHELMLSIRLRDDTVSYCNANQLLYHFTESSNSNTMRYRWLMFDEQQAKPLEGQKLLTQHFQKYIGFSDILTNTEKTMRSFRNSIPETYKLVQFKYILDRRSRTEHILAAIIDHGNDPIFVHKSSLACEDFVTDAKITGEELHTITLPHKFNSLVDNSRAALNNSHQKARSAKRQNLESNLSLLLHSFEEECLGPFRIILCGRCRNASYNTFVDSAIVEIKQTLNRNCSFPELALRSFVENAPILSREEFCQVLGLMFNVHPRSDGVYESFRKWTKSMENFIAKEAPGLNKATFMQTVRRHQVGLILDRQLEHIPFESLPIARVTKQGYFRVPSLRLFSAITNRRVNTADEVDSARLAYVLDPANNLSKTRERFESKLKVRKSWLGVVGQAPLTDHLEAWLAERDIYLFIGHGAGSIYYNKLCDSRGLSAIPKVRSVPIVMGCSSGRVMAEGPRLESFGINWIFIFRGAPSYLGLLWDVTDTDIDRFLDVFLSRWMPRSWASEETGAAGDKNSAKGAINVTDATALSRQVCQYKFLVGATPVTYGLPVSCIEKNSDV